MDISRAEWITPLAEHMYAYTTATTSVHVPRRTPCCAAYFSCHDQATSSTALYPPALNLPYVNELGTFADLPASLHSAVISNGAGGAASTCSIAILNAHQLWDRPLQLALTPTCTPRLQ